MVHAYVCAGRVARAPSCSATARGAPTRAALEQVAHDAVKLDAAPFFGTVALLLFFSTSAAKP